jgi:hypothetical protein
MNDVESQIHFVSESVERILGLIDADPLSPTFGCAHLDYWRDKTSDVADIRRQEVMLALARLYVVEYPGSLWRGEPRLESAVRALLSYWIRSQYPDGSFDEWYKGERAFAAAAFSAHAVARTLEILKDRLPEQLDRLAREKLLKTSLWLSRRNDLFKTNHQAVGAAALAWAGMILQDSRFTRAAREKLYSILRVQTPEGWFPELGHMDIGYTFLTVEFAAMTMDLLKDWSWLESFRRAFDFACEWVHPDLTIGEEYGSCHNPYLSQIAVFLMSPHSGRAAYLRRRLEQPGTIHKRCLATLRDDLRLVRWAFQPLLAYEYMRSIPSAAGAPEKPIPLADPESRNASYPAAGLERMVLNQMPFVIAACAGGLTRLFNLEGDTLSDYGYAVATPGGYATNFTYNRKLKLMKEENAFSLDVPIAPVSKFMPSFLSRVILRLASSTALGSRVTRRLIDVIRKKKGTSVNQASANLSARSGWRLHRTIRLSQNAVTVTDRLSFTSPIKRDRIFFLRSINQGPMELISLCQSLPALPGTFARISISRVYTPANLWQLTDLSARLEKGD